MAKRYEVHIRKTLSENTIMRDVRKAICRRVSIGDECNHRWVPAKPPMKLPKKRWIATGGAIVDSLKRKYVFGVNRQEIGPFHTKELTTYRKFLTDRITSRR